MPMGKHIRSKQEERAMFRKLKGSGGVVFYDVKARKKVRVKNVKLVRFKKSKTLAATAKSPLTGIKMFKFIKKGK